MTSTVWNIVAHQPFRQKEVEYLFLLILVFCSTVITSLYREGGKDGIPFRNQERFCLRKGGRND